jgi:hypothetical protein
MIAVEHKRGNVGLGESAHLPDKEQSRLIVAPIPIIEIASDDEEGSFPFDYLTNEIVECFSRRRPDPLRSASFVTSQPLEGTVEMNVRSVNETE